MYIIKYQQQKTKGIETAPISEQAFGFFGERKESDKQIFEGLRSASYHRKDLQDWLNAVVYDRFVSEPPRSPVVQVGPRSFKSSHITPVMVDELIAMIEEKEIDITVDYNDWFAIGCSFANYFGEEGRARFHAVSQFYPGYSTIQTDEKFDDALRGGYNYNISTFIYYAHNAGATAFVDFQNVPEELI